MTHPRVFQTPSPLSTAVDQLDAWMECPSLHLIGETSLHWRLLREFLVRAKTLGPRVHDARIAAICRQHGIQELWTADRDFSAFPDLRGLNPCVNPTSL